MIRKLLVIGLAVWLLTSCSVPGLGLRRLRVGPLRTQQVDIPLPEDANRQVDLFLRFGAARLSFGGGADRLVRGTICYNVEQFKPFITVADGKVRIEQGEDLEAALPPSGTRNEWSLQVSDVVPYYLRVEAGAYQGTWNLGGLRLRRLDIVEGATQATYAFDRPNPDVMEELNVTTGASRVHLRNLVNANFRQMGFDAGIGEYTLDFGGQLRQAATVRIRTGVSTVMVSVPQTTPARVRLRGALRSVQIDGDFRQDGDDYMKPGWAGASSGLDIVVEMGLGTLTLRCE
mgnify:CR=1 FL=1